MSQEIKAYEILNECWIKEIRYVPAQLIKLTDVEAREWLDRKCIKLCKKSNNGSTSK